MHKGDLGCKAAAAAALRRACARPDVCFDLAQVRHLVRHTLWLLQGLSSLRITAECVSVAGAACSSWRVQARRSRSAHTSPEVSHIFWMPPIQQYPSTTVQTTICSTSLTSPCAQKPKFLHVLLRVMGTPSPVAAAAAAAAIAALAAAEPVALAAAEPNLGLCASLAALAGDSGATPAARASAALALKHLVAESPAARDRVAGDGGAAAAVTAALACPEAAYDAARVLRFLAVAGKAEGRQPAAEVRRV